MTTGAAARLLIVDDEQPQLQALCDTLQQEGFITHGFTSPPEAVAALREQPFDLLLTDLVMPQIDGITLLQACHEVDRDLACIVMTGHASVSTAVEALKAGAFDYVVKPLGVNSILTAITRALTVRRLRLENIQLRESVSICELARSISQGLDRDAITARTVAAAAQQSDVAAVYLFTPTAAGHFQLAGSAGPRAILFEDGQHIGADTLDPWLVQARRDLELPGDDTQVRAPFSHPFDRRIGVALPVIAGESLFGVLGFTSTRSPRRISPGQLKSLDVLARTAAAAFAAATMLADLKKANAGLEARVQQHTEDLAAANKDLDAFSYSVSHDLREPLRAIEGFCEMFRTEFGAAIPEAGAPVFERIVTAAQRMSRRINDLLHYSRFGRHPLNRQQVDLRRLVLQTVQALQQGAASRQIEVEVGALPDCFGDPVLLEQVLVNLLSNAFKFTAGREPARVQVGALRQGEHVAYYVRDNGIGFDMRYADRLFGVFQRFHPQDAFEGTGIGLSIVHRIITRHGGRVRADSRPGEGTTLFFSLPAQADVR
jgi:signal transduction histidine kinase/FixJ family two-component response regulator